jgi:hypothetical protein
VPCNQFLKQVIRFGMIHRESDIDSLDLELTCAIPWCVNRIKDDAGSSTNGPIQMLDQAIDQLLAFTLQPSGIGVSVWRGYGCNDVVTIDQ